jgi:hypothetical protein
MHYVLLYLLEPREWEQPYGHHKNYNYPCSKQISPTLVTKFSLGEFILAVDGLLWFYLIKLMSRDFPYYAT